jgi:hypothetical protein
MDGPVAAYVRTTRRHLQDRCFSFYYDGMLLKFQELLAAAKVSPEQLVVIYSPTRLCETVKIGGRTIVLYDQYLGQTLNNLNRHFLVFKNPAAAMEYFHRLLAEFFSEYDLLLPEATFCVSHYSKGKETPRSFDFIRSKSKKKVKNGLLNEVLRALYTTTQEQYILAHELLHEIFQQEEKSLSGLNSEMLNAFPPIEDFIETQIEHLEDFKNNRSDYFRRLKEVTPRELKKRLLGSSIANFKKEMEGEDFNEQIQVLRESKVLREELFCDNWAAILVALNSLNATTQRDAGKGAISRQEQFRSVLKAIYVGHHHLRIINLLRDGVRGYYLFVTGAKKKSVYASSEYKTRQIITQIRSQYLKDLCAKLYASFELLNDLQNKRQAGQTVSQENDADLPLVAMVVSLLTVDVLLTEPDKHSSINRAYENFDMQLIEQQRNYYDLFADRYNNYIFEMLFGGELEGVVRKQVAANGGSLDDLRDELGDPETVAGLRRFVELSVGLGQASPDSETSGRP